MQDSRYTTQAADYRRFFVNGRTLALALGYGLFRGANSLLYSSALASVPTSTLFIADMSFSMTTALSSLLCALAVMALAWKGLILGFRLPVVLPALLLLLVAAPAVAPWIAPGSSGVFVLLALTYGVASTCLNLSWLEVVAHQTPARIAGILALGMLVKSVITLACGSLMGVPFVVAVGVLLVGAVALLLRARGRAWLDSSEDDAAPATFKAYRQGAMGIADALVVSIVLEATVSILNGFFLGVATDGSGIISAVGAISAALVFCFVVVVVARAVDVGRLYRYLFPILLALVVLLPLTLGSWASQALQGLLVLVYEFISFSALYFILCQIQRKKLKTYVLFAFATACIRLSQLLFGMAGYWLGGASGSEAEGLYWIVTIAAVYGLSMLLLYLTRRRPSTDEKRVIVVTEEDRFAARAEELAAEYRITARESEIMLQLARGRSAAFIADELVCSPATVRTHMKNIYAKLGVHSKQELIDLFAD